MPSPLVTYLASRPDTATFLLGSELGRTVEEIFPRAETLLPKPYKIFPADETQAPALGFPVADAPVMRELDAKLDRWLTDEVAWQVGAAAGGEGEGAAREQRLHDAAHAPGRERADVEPAQRLSRRLLAGAFVRSGAAVLVDPAARQHLRHADRPHAGRRLQVPHLRQVGERHARGDGATGHESVVDSRWRRTARTAVLPAPAPTTC